ncbi:MAG: methylenetetrahydrofolate reductase [Actinomycetaceae bacterium]|nr:methylenetetrahydrofolate reductase [Actinomycetaceae bacterium]
MTIAGYYTTQQNRSRTVSGFPEVADAGAVAAVVSKTRKSLPTVSFELYPPRTTNPQSSVWERLDRLIKAAPDWVSVTYGASGSTTGNSQLVLDRVAKLGTVPAVAHLTCIGATEEQLDCQITSMLNSGVRNFLALRGDIPGGQVDWRPGPGEYIRAVQLVELIRKVAARELPDGVGHHRNGTGIDTAKNPADYVSISVACYPAAKGQGRRNDIAALIEKQTAGADYAITQVFYDVDDYASLHRQAQVAGVSMPIIAGIIPLTDLKRLHRLESLTGVQVPQWLESIFDEPDARIRVHRLLKATFDLCQKTVASGAPGLHVYTFNRPRPTLDVLQYIRAGGFPDIPADSRMPVQGRRNDRQIDMELIDEALNRITPGG